MLNPGGDIEDLYRDFAKNYPLKTDDSGWDEFLQKMESAPVKKLPPDKPGAGNPFASIVKKYGYWLSAAALVVVLSGVFVLNNKKENNGPPAATGDLVENSIPLRDSNTKQQPLTKPGETKQVDNGAGKQSTGHAQENQPVTTVPKAKPSVTTAEKQLASSPNVGQPTEKPGHAKENSDADTKNALQENKVDGAVNLRPYASNTKGKKNTTGELKGSISPKAMDSHGSIGNTKQQLNDNNKAGDEKSALVAEPQKPNAKAKDSVLNENSLINDAALTNNPGDNKKVVDTFHASIRPLTLSNNTQDSAQTQLSILAEATTAANKPLNNSDTALNQSLATDSAGIAGNTFSPNLKTNAKALAVLPNATDKHTDSFAAVQPLLKISTADKKYFYAGLTAGPDFSTVKFQTIQKTGSNIGLVLGVYLGHHVSLESGLLFTAKKYYTSGAYFKGGLLLPPDRDDLISLNASGNFLEVPLTLKYDIVHKKRFNLFVNGGLSSYFTGNEKYELVFHRAFGYETRHAESDELCSNIFSLIHVSAGLEFKLNTNNLFRLEPYIKLPLSGIGTGSLPVTSSGLYINFTHRF